MAKKCFVLHKEVINEFHEVFTLPQFNYRHFILIMLGLLVRWNVGGLKMIVSMIMHQKTI